MKKFEKLSKKINMIKRPNFLIAIFLITIITIGCGSNLKLHSYWRDREIAIDGMHTDWQGAMTFIEKENVAIGIINDEKFLYVSMVTTNRDIQRQIMLRGFTLWLDPDGGKEKSFGIKFPLGMQEMGFMMRGRGEEPNIETMQENFKKSMISMEIIGPGKGQHRVMRVAEAEGIEIKVNPIVDQFAYEIKIPLSQTENQPYAIGAEAGQSIGVGFETTEFDREMMLEGMGGGRPGGRGGSRPSGGIGGGRAGGRGGGRMGGGRPQMPKQFKLWVSVQLLSGNVSILPYNLYRQYLFLNLTSHSIQIYLEV